MKPAEEQNTFESLGEWGICFAGQIV